MIYDVTNGDGFVDVKTQNRAKPSCHQQKIRYTIIIVMCVTAMINRNTILLLSCISYILYSMMVENIR